MFQQDLDAEFTAARLLISKMKGEILTVIDKAKEAETNLTDQHKIIEQKEKELHEYRNSFHNFNSYSKSGPISTLEPQIFFNAKNLQKK